MTLNDLERQDTVREGRLAADQMVYKRIRQKKNAIFLANTLVPFDLPPNLAV